MADDIETLLRKAACITIDDGIPVERCVLSRELVFESADTIARLRADLTETIGLLRIAQGFVMAAPIKHPQQTQLKHDLVKRIASILASHKENTDG